MSEIRTSIQHSEIQLASQNKVIKSYATQLRSSVISSERRRDVLNKMCSEMLAEQFRRPEKRSAEIVVKNAATTFSRKSLQTSVDNDFIRTLRHTDYIKNAKVLYSEDVKSVIAASENLEEKIRTADKIFCREAILRNMRIKQMRLKNKKYTISKSDTNNSPVLESAQLICSAADTIIQTGGIIRTAVRNETIKIGSSKGINKIAAAVSIGVKNIAADMGNQLIKTKIDKSKITDTGTEAIKQGLTEIRYADNARKAILNTAITAVKAGYAVKNMPRDTRAQVNRIRKNAERLKEAKEKAVLAIKKILTSKAGLIIIAALILILLVVSLLNGLVTVVVTAITSLFSWLVSEDGSKDTEEILDDYSASIVEYIEKKQDEIDEIVEGFVCDKRQYPPYDEISELNRFGNKDIVIEDENSILAILAVLRYRELGDSEEIEFEFTDEEIQEVIDKFYTFEYYYTYGHCSAPYCKRKTTTTVYNEGTPYEYTVETTEYYCDVDHQWLHGEVTNHTAEEVMEEYNFTDEEKNLYKMYLAQIEAMTGDDENV